MLPDQLPMAHREPPPGYDADTRPESWVVLEREQSELGDWPYDYIPLTEANVIRILVLDPSDDFEDDLKGELQPVSLSDINDENGYITLSYACGDECQDQDEIYIGTGKQEEYPTIAIEPNLASALRHLRRKDRLVRLWVDAICINQIDLTERNHQVYQMRAIFSSAEETIIFLGDEGGNFTLSAWNFLERNSEWAMDENGDRNCQRPALQEELIDFRGDLSDVEIDVLTRPWFQRVWAFQEIVVSKNVSIQCGCRRVGWDDFCKILLLSPRYHDRYGLSLRWDDKIETVRDLFHARCIYQETLGLGNLSPPWHSQVDNYKGRTMDILHTLERGRRLEAKDPKDKIYALLGISTGIDLENPLVEIDYGKPYLEVCINFARYVVESSNSYDLLSYVYDPLDLLPSWVPNWEASPPSRNTRTLLSILETESDERKLGRERLTKSSHVWLNAKTLVITQGYVIGEVSDCGPEVQLQGQNERAFQNLRDEYSDDYATLYEKIMGLWIHGICQMTRLEAETGRFPRRGQRSDRPRRFLQGKVADFSNLINISPDVSKDSVEYHMFSRARKTASWKDDENKAFDWVIDKSSILDWKRIGLCTSVPKPCTSDTHPAEDRLMILPPDAELGDLVVYFRGGRVPFVVRRSEPPFPLERETRHMEVKEGLKALGVDCISELVHCKIIGECLVNGFGELARDEVARTTEDEWSPLKKSFEKSLKTMFVLT
jgi:Heterokaryon incompatibility protein (HET)